MPSSTPSLVEDLEREFARLDEILHLLGVEEEGSMRADLAEELAREASAVEDAQEHSVYPFVAEAGLSESSDRLRRSSAALRAAIEPVFDAVHNSVPMDVHLHAPQALHEYLDHLCEEVRRHLALERNELARVNLRFDDAQRNALSEHFASARRHAVERPRAPQNRFVRAYLRFVDRLDRTFPDTSHQWRPGRQKLEASTTEVNSSTSGAPTANG